MSAGTSVSVCIPTYNAAEFLREAVGSALAQTRPPDEIVVVDDGSTDHTREVCRSFGARVRYVRQERDGTLGAGARARAMREARGEWLALLDHDDLWLPRKLERQLAAAAAHPDAAAVFARHRPVDAAGRPTGPPAELSGADVRHDARAAYHLLLRKNHFAPSSALLRRAFFAEHGVTDPRRVGCADWDLWLSVARGGHAIVVVEDELVDYRVFPDQFCADKGRLAAALERTLASQRRRLHPDCADCRESFRAGREHVAFVYRVAVNALLDEYHAATRAGQLPRALPFLWDAVRTAPSEVLRPRRLAAVSKNALLGALRGVRF
jgi:glycosyltransferase involved in cell wall biosynthesis